MLTKLLPSRILITGASGQLGTRLVTRLLRESQVKRIFALDRVLPRVADARVVPILGDLADLPFSGIFEQVDAVVHLAFLVTQGGSDALLRRTNVDASRRLLTAALEAQVAQVVHLSSVAAYGLVPGHDLPLSESAPRQPTPNLRYATHKYEVEQLLDLLEPRYPNSRLLRFRPGVLLGERVPHGFGAALQAPLLVAASPLPCCFVWDEDVAEAIFLGLASDRRGAFNLAAREQRPLAELAVALDVPFLQVPAATAGLAAGALRWLQARSQLAPSFDPDWLTALEAPITVDSSRAETELGWRPAYPTAAAVLARFRAGR